MSGAVAILDACALIPTRLATTLLWLAEANLFQPLWSERILDEVQRNLPNVEVAPERAHRRVGMMRDAFGAEALIENFEGLIETMTCDSKDRHVLATAIHGDPRRSTAIHGEASMLVTFNLKDFPDEATAPHGIQAIHPGYLPRPAAQGEPRHRRRDP